MNRAVIVLKAKLTRSPHAVRHNFPDVCILGGHPVIGPLILHNSQLPEENAFESGKRRSTYHTTQRHIVRAPASASCAAAASPAAALFAAASADAVDCSLPCGPRRRVKSRSLAAAGGSSRPLMFPSRPVSLQSELRPLQNEVLWAQRCPPVALHSRRAQASEKRHSSAHHLFQLATRGLAAGKLAGLPRPWRTVQLMSVIVRPKEKPRKQVDGSLHWHRTTRFTFAARLHSSESALIQLSVLVPVMSWKPAVDKVATTKWMDTMHGWD